MNTEKRSLSGSRKTKLRYTIRGGFDFDTMGHTRYHELRKFVKKGNDFCKELGNIMQERAELELNYAKTMSKLSAKLMKAAKKGIGSIQNAWLMISKEMEAEGQAHRCIANSLEDDIVKPLKNLQETHCRIKKTVEYNVSKTKKCMNKWRTDERRSKKESFAVARENEKVQDMTTDASYSILTSNGNLAKDATKLENKKKKLEESVKKSYTEYYTYCVRTARAKLEWEMSINNGEKNFLTLEEERLLRLKEYAQHVLQSYQKFAPKISQISSRLSEPIYDCDVSKDFAIITDTANRYDEDLSLQVLPDFYPEHTNLAMNKKRRILALTKILQLVRQDLDRERRSKKGLDTLANAMHHSAGLKHDDDSQKNVYEKLHHTNLMILYLEAVNYKVVTALETLEGHPPTVSNTFAQHIETTRDKNGHQMSVLKMPASVCQKLTTTPSAVTTVAAHESMWSDRGSADGTDIDDFSSDEDDGADEENVDGPRCKALYHYSAKLNDELSLEPGDVIHVHSKKSDGWWLGELKGVTGVFPATYVVEID
ncbi:nostrin [Sipha flava]|uniref:Nostrin n=1 Tax=Sipha flava TaxID=143950 RepID=A0A2S2Q193_9HEMI|nr:nostrin [Sipha flava]